MAEIAWPTVDAPTASKNWPASKTDRAQCGFFIAQRAHRFGIPPQQRAARRTALKRPRRASA
eukprot:15459972-Alexandrium_andersonii.AAC.1